MSADTADQRVARLLEALGAIARATFSGAEIDDAYQRGNTDAHVTCSRMARAALDEYGASLSALERQPTKYIVPPEYVSPSVVQQPPSGNAQLRRIADFLWSLLDDIDTASDIAKADDKAYRTMVERIQRRRFDVGTTDGYTVTFIAEQRTGES